MRTLGGLSVALHDGVQVVEIGLFRRPALHIVHVFRLSDDNRLTRKNLDFIGQTQHLLSAFVDDLAHQLHLLSVFSVVVQLGFHKDGVAGVVVPHMDAIRFDAHLVGHLEHHWPVDAERLRPFAESPLTAASATYPRHVGDAGRMAHTDRQPVVAARQDIGRDIDGLGGASYVKMSQGMTIEGDVGVGSNALEAQETGLVRHIRRSESLLKEGLSVQIAVLTLLGAVVVVKIDGDGSCQRPVGCWRGNGPVVVELQHCAVSAGLGRREVQLALSHVAARSNGYATLSVTVHGAIEMVDHAVVLHHIALVGKHLIVGF